MLPVDFDEPVVETTQFEFRTQHIMLGLATNAV